MNKKSLFYYSLLSALLLIISWPEIGGLSLLIFFAFIPLLYVEDYYSNKDQKTFFKFFGWSYLSFLFWNIGTTCWVFNAAEWGSIGAFSLNALFQAIAFSLFHFSKKKLGSVPGWFALVFFWIGWEYLHLDWDLSWPWLTLGNVFANTTWAIQWYEWTGVFGGSLWVLVSNVLFYYAFKYYSIGKKEGEKDYKVFIKPILKVGGPILVSLLLLWSRGSQDLSSNEKLTTIVVQPNVDPYNEKFASVGHAKLLSSIGNALEKSEDKDAILVLPETALQEWNKVRLSESNPDSLVFWGLWENQLENAITIQDMREILNRNPQLRILGGMASDGIVQPNKWNKNSIRPLGNTGNYYESFNTSFFLDKSDSIQIYHKSKLVVSVELFPFKSILKPLLGDAVIDLGGSTGTLGIQPNRTPMLDEKTGAKIVPAICYESIYGEFIGDFIKNGANIIFIVTNDGWWGDTPGYKQHMAYARLRAIETRKNIVRSANTGTSCTIDYLGNVSNETPYWEEASFVSSQELIEGETFYVKYGDVIGRAAAFLSIMLLIYTFIVVIKQKEDKYKNT